MLNSRLHLQAVSLFMPSNSQNTPAKPQLQKESLFSRLNRTTVAWRSLLKESVESSHLINNQLKKKHPAGQGKETDKNVLGSLLLSCSPSVLSNRQILFHTITMCLKKELQFIQGCYKGAPFKITLRSYITANSQLNTDIFLKIYTYFPQRSSVQKRFTCP